MGEELTVGEGASKRKGYRAVRGTAGRRRCACPARPDGVGGWVRRMGLGRRREEGG
jgi:hypothetical protein